MAKRTSRNRAKALPGSQPSAEKIQGIEYILKKLGEGFEVKEGANKGSPKDPSTRQSFADQAVRDFAARDVSITPDALNIDGTRVKLVHPQGHHVNAINVPWNRELSAKEVAGFDERLAEQAAMVQARALIFDREILNDGADVIASMVLDHGWQVVSGREIQGGKVSRNRRDNLDQATKLLGDKGVKIDVGAMNKDRTSIRLGKVVDGENRTVYVPWGQDLTEDKLVEIETAAERSQGQNRRAQMQPRTRGARKTGRREQGLTKNKKK